MTFEPALPCAMLQLSSSGIRSLCGQPATTGVLTPVKGGVFEMLPVCPYHLTEARWQAQATVGRLPSIDSRTKLDNN